MKRGEACGQCVRIGEASPWVSRPGQDQAATMVRGAWGVGGWVRVGKCLQ